MKTIISAIIAVFLSVSFNTVNGQDSFNYTIDLKPVEIEGLPGLHSYAYAQHDGKWLFIGGRRDGLHARQPFNAFPENFNNLDIFVADVDNNQLWTGTLNDLSTGIKEQLQSTNLNFYQSADTLYVIGGYSFTASVNDHITHPKMTSLIVSDVINSIIEEEPIAPYFQQIEDDIFANTGGQMGKIGEHFYLIGGHRFDGRYNPMGNPTYVQTYKTGIQKFKINNTTNGLSISDYTFTEDPLHLRRRDYNLLPQIFPDGSEGYMLSAGVFQINADLPFLYPVDISENSYEPRTEFNQYLSHYHGAKTAIYDEQANEMHNLFYGGISQYYYENGTLIQDNEVPFVNTISRVTRDSNGDFQEFQLPIQMLGLKGAGSEFIPNLNIAYTSSKVLKINDVVGDSILIGHIFGGIETDSKNPFSNNQTDQTSADASLLEVWLIREEGLDVIEIDGKTPYQVNVFPNPVNDEIKIQIEGQNIQSFRYFISSSEGKILQEGTTATKDNLSNPIIKLKNSISSQQLMLTLVINDMYYLKKALVKE